jgi:hypothetical protein
MTMDTLDGTNPRQGRAAELVLLSLSARFTVIVDTLRIGDKDP